MVSVSSYIVLDDEDIKPKMKYPPPSENLRSIGKDNMYSHKYKQNIFKINKG